MCSFRVGATLRVRVRVRVGVKVRVRVRVMGLRVRECTLERHVLI